MNQNYTSETSASILPDDSNFETASPLPAAPFAAEALAVNRLHTEILSHATASLTKAVELGRLLSAVRAKLPHGSWQTWLEANASFGARQARRYVSVFESRAALLKAGPVDLADALKLLSGPRDETPDQDQKPSNSNGNLANRTSKSGLEVPQTVIQAKPDSAPSESPGPRRDAHGTPIPQRCLRALVQAEETELNRFMQAAGSLRAFFERRQGDCAGIYSVLAGRVQDPMNDAQEIYRMLAQCSPDYVCPQCSGEGTHNGTCDICRGVGMISKSAWREPVSKRTRPALVDAMKKLGGAE